MVVGMRAGYVVSLVELGKLAPRPGRCIAVILGGATHSIIRDARAVICRKSVGKSGISVGKRLGACRTRRCRACGIRILLHLGDVSNTIILVQIGFVKYFIVFSHKLTVGIVYVGDRVIVINGCDPAHIVIIIQRCYTRCHAAVNHLVDPGAVKSDASCKRSAAYRVLFAFQTVVYVIGVLCHTAGGFRQTKGAELLTQQLSSKTILFKQW